MENSVCRPESETSQRYLPRAFDVTGPASRLGDKDLRASQAKGKESNAFLWGS